MPCIWEVGESCHDPSAHRPDRVGKSCRALRESRFKMALTLMASSYSRSTHHLKSADKAVKAVTIVL